VTDHTEPPTEQAIRDFIETHTLQAMFARCACGWKSAEVTTFTDHRDHLAHAIHRKYFTQETANA
jgi:hypothetical protein